MPLDGGRFATSDLNDLYRRVINRNNRLKRLLELRAPGHHRAQRERMLQESVDALFDNGRRGRVITGTNKRPLKSLSDMLKVRARPLPSEPARQARGLLGPFGDRGRSGAETAPVRPAEENGARTVSNRSFTRSWRSTASQRPSRLRSAWSRPSALKCGTSSRKSCVSTRYCSTAHRPTAPPRHPGVRADADRRQNDPAAPFRWCVAFNADFDGDQMAVHVPLSIESQLEARVLMMSTNNILSPANRPIIVPSQDMVLWPLLSRWNPTKDKGEGRRSAISNEIEMALRTRSSPWYSKIKARFAIMGDNNKIRHEIIDTTPGRP